MRRDEIEKELEFIKNKTDKKVTAADVTEMFKFLNYKVGKHEVEEMLWEVDENLDGCLDWNEFRLMFNRNVLDQTGLEPNRMVSKYVGKFYTLEYNCLHTSLTLL